MNNTTSTKEAPSIGMDAVLAAYRPGEEVDNRTLYNRVRLTTGIAFEEWERKQPVGVSGQEHSLASRRSRWHQQSLRKLGIIERVPGKRGVWRLTTGQEQLTAAPAGVHLVAYSTNLGLALWSCNSVFSKLDEPIHLILTSPPYPLRKQRAYGNPSAKEFVSFLIDSLEPLIKTLVPGGSIALNLSNDIFNQGLPSRSTYLERVVIALEDKGLHLMDRLIWSNPSKPPGPIAWASKSRQQLNVGWEPVLWFTNDPKACFADNRRVLEPHTDRQTRLIEQGGTRLDADYCDGAYRRKAGAFGNPTDGRIPKNVIEIGHASAEAKAARRLNAAQGLRSHGAMYPVRLAKFLIQFLTRPGDLVADPFGGWNTTGLAAEMTDRRWITTEKVADYAAGGAVRFHKSPGFLSSFDLVAP
jgi:DNA modification methylase